MESLLENDKYFDDLSQGRVIQVDGQQAKSQGVVLPNFQKPGGQGFNFLDWLFSLPMGHLISYVMAVVAILILLPLIIRKLRGR
jgi:hypothetical protein